MGNRKGRSTELAVRLLTEQVQTAWQHKAAVSLLQLDIRGAFDTVHHVRLLHTLREKGFPPWTVRWVRSFLTNRTATLAFDDALAQPARIHAGVPQGSPLSPILFLLYTSTLYDELRYAPGTTTVGFADDTNILAFGRTTQQCVRALERAWGVCEAWAARNGMQFEPSKCELIHFSRARARPTETVRLGPTEVRPTDSARLLGVWIDRKLRWRVHLREVQKKLETQRLSLTRLTRSTRGLPLLQAREVYTKVIRAAIAYGSTAYHVTSRGGPKGITKDLAKEQTRCLRIVAGAYRATAARALETETYTPPLDLYLTERNRRFEDRLAQGAAGQVIQKQCDRVRRAAGPRRPRGRRAPDQTLDWRGIQEEWKARWEREIAHSLRSRSRLPADEPPTKRVLRLHHGLGRAESSMLVQMRTEKIGLRAFLFAQRVPDVPTPICRCGEGRETVAHVAAHCRWEERPTFAGSQSAFDATLWDPGGAARAVRWFARARRFQGYLDLPTT
jgi:hypothetical protein